MHGCTRRAFRKGGALSLLGLGGGLGGVPRFLVRTAYAQDTGPRPKVLIAIFQRGAVDGLSMVVPHGDPDYYAARGGIAIAPPAAGNAGLASVPHAGRAPQPLASPCRRASAIALGS